MAAVFTLTGGEGATSHVSTSVAYAFCKRKKSARRKKETSAPSSGKAVAFLVCSKGKRRSTPTETTRGKGGKKETAVSSLKRKGHWTHGGQHGERRRRGNGPKTKNKREKDASPWREKEGGQTRLFARGGKRKETSLSCKTKQENRKKKGPEFGVAEKKKGTKEGRSGADSGPARQEKRKKGHYLDGRCEQRKDGAIRQRTPNEERKDTVRYIPAKGAAKKERRASLSRFQWVRESRHFLKRGRRGALKSPKKENLSGRQG